MIDNGFKKILSLLLIVRKNAREPENLGVFEQLIEIAKLWFSYGLGPNYYLLAGFCSKDIPWKLKASHKSEKEYRKWIGVKNPILYRKISQNKLVESAMLRFMNVSTTQFLGFLHTKNGIDADFQALTSLSQFDSMLRKTNSTAIVIKPLEGYGGYGVRVCDVDLENKISMLTDRANSNKFPLSGDNAIARELLSNEEGWVIEEYFEQHVTLANINSSSVNTIRMWVTKPPGKAAHCVSGYLRIGRKGSVVDNQSSGGIVCPIEHQTGVLKKTQSGTPERILYTHHPDHNAKIEGIQLPYWLECQLLAEKAISIFPHMNFCGMDIAIGKEGPVIIELNSYPDKEGAAFMQIQFPE